MLFDGFVMGVGVGCMYFIIERDMIWRKALILGVNS